MPGKTLRIVRRPKGRAGKRPSTALVAASQPVLDVAQSFKSSMGGRAAAWQDIAWEMYARVGELRYYVGWRAGSCSRSRLVASRVDESGKPTGSLKPLGTEDADTNEADDARVQEIVRAIANGPQGQAQMVRRLVEGLSVPGETWLAILDTGEVDFDGNPKATWCVVSKDEVKTAGNGAVEILLPSGEKHEYKEGHDQMIHLWNPDPRIASEPTSPVRATLDPLQEIVRTTKTIANASKSRLIGNGIVIVPSEMSLPATQGPVSDKEDLDPLDEFAAVSGTPAVKQLQELLWEVAVTAYDDEDSMAALIPIFASAPGEMVKNISHLKFDNQVTQVAIQTRNDAISRLAMGLDMAPERMLGIGSSTNHWTAWQISDEDVQLHISPPMAMICDALTTNILHRILEEEGIDPRKYVVWFDVSGLTTDPDKTTAATNAYTNGAINGKAFLDYLGLDSSAGYDFDTEEGWRAWARDICSRQPQFAPIFAKLLGPKGGDLPLVLETATNDGTGPPSKKEITQPQQQKSVGSGPAKKPQTEQSSKATSKAGTQASAAPAVTLNLAEMLLFNRAMELVGKRRRKRSDYARLRDIPLHETHLYMPPVDPAEVPSLVAGWDSGLADEAIQMLGVDTESMRSRVYEAIKRELTAPLVDIDGG